MIEQLSAKALSRACPRQEGQAHVTVGGTDRLYQARLPSCGMLVVLAVFGRCDTPGLSAFGRAPLHDSAINRVTARASAHRLTMAGLAVARAQGIPGAVKPRGPAVALSTIRRAGPRGLTPSAAPGPR
jgi:hypothetical protein